MVLSLSRSRMRLLVHDNATPTSPGPSSSGSTPLGAELSSVRLSLEALGADGSLCSGPLVILHLFYPSGLLRITGGGIVMPPDPGLVSSEKSSGDRRRLPKVGVTSQELNPASPRQDL